MRMMVLFAFVLGVLIASSPYAAAQKSTGKAAPNQALVDACRKKYPDPEYTGGRQTGRNAAALRRQCVQSGGKM
jgi:hypothetical protein